MSSTCVNRLSSHPKGPSVIKPSVVTLSKEEENEIIHTHDQTHDQSFDSDSLFILTQNVLNPTIQIMEQLEQGSDGQVGKYKLEEKNPSDPNFKAPLCTLQFISNELNSCKPTGEEIAKKTALSILQKLPDYKWEAKAVLTLAAFANDFGDFWLFADRFESDTLLKQFALLKNVPQLINKGELIQKHGHEFQELSSLIKKTIRVIAIIDEFEQLSRAYGLDKIPELPTVYKSLQLDVYWTIVTIAAIATKFSTLTRDEPDEKPYDIAPFAQKIHSILKKLEQRLKISKQQADENQVFIAVDKAFGTQTPVVVALRKLLYYDHVEPLFDGSTNKLVDINVLKDKKILLFISTLEITKEDVAIVRQIYEKVTKVKEFESYSIVWAPVVDEWSKDSWNKIDSLQVRFNLPFYIVQQHYSAVAGIKYIKEKWNFKGKPIIVKLSALAEVIEVSKITNIRPDRLDLFLIDDRIPYETNWFASVFRKNEISDIVTWIKEEKFFFIYGGENARWIQKLNESFSTFKNIVKMDTEPQTLENIAKGDEGSVVEEFWNDIQQLLIKKAKKSELDNVTEDIQKLLSFRRDAWAVLIKGSTVITTYGPAAHNVVEQVDKWEEAASKEDFDFEATFREHYAHVPSDCLPEGCQFDLPISIELKCPGSSHPMETNVTYKCNFGTTTASTNVPNAQP